MDEVKVVSRPNVRSQPVSRLVRPPVRRQPDRDIYVSDG